jgi:hypothetical protein
MSDLTPFPVDLVSEAADYVIAELKDDPDAVMSIPIPNGIPLRARTDLIDHHHAVVREIRRRGWSAKAIVRHTPAGSVLAIELMAAG